MILLKVKQLYLLVKKNISNKSVKLVFFVYTNFRVKCENIRDNICILYIYIQIHIL